MLRAGFDETHELLRRSIRTFVEREEAPIWMSGKIAKSSPANSIARLRAQAFWA